MKKNILQFVLFLGVGSGLLWLVFRQQNAAFKAQCAIDGVPSEQCSLVQKIWSDFATANYWLIGLTLVFFTISNLSRAFRWQMLIQPLGYTTRLTNGFGSILLGYFANLGLPRVGEVVRAGTMAKYENIPVEKLIGTIVVDRIVDMVSLLLLITLSLVVEFDTIFGFIRQSLNGRQGSTSSSFLLPALVGAAVFGFAFLFFIRKKITRQPFFQKLLSVAKGFLDGLGSIGKLRTPKAFIFHSIVIWLMYYLQCYFCLLAFPPTAHLTSHAALMVFIFGTLGMVVPSPGGMGTYHALVILALTSLYGIGSNDAFSLANLSFFSIQIFYNITAGVLALLLLPLINAKTKA